MLAKWGLSVLTGRKGSQAELLARKLAGLQRENDALRAANVRLKTRMAELAGAHVFENKYRGEAARNYDAGRSESKMWRREDKAVARFLSKMAEGTTILDVPVGTGRFVPHYAEHKFRVTGIDTSDDMLRLAREKCDSNSFDMELQVGNVMNLKYEDRAFDCTICVRLLNFFTKPELARAIEEISRVTKTHLALTIRLNDDISKPQHSVVKKTIVHPTQTFLNLMSSNDFDILERHEIGRGEDGTNYIVIAQRRNA